jgi:hypothetical protein
MRRYSHRGLSDAEETTLASILRTRFISINQYCPPRMINLLALKIWHGDVPTFSEEEEQGRNLDGEEDPSDDDDSAELLDLESDDSDEVIFDDEQASEDDLLGEENDDGLDAPDEAYDPHKGHSRHDGKRPFTASNKWRRGFMNRHGFSIRKPHPKRRPAVDDEQRSVFIETMTEILTRLPASVVLNMDETSWKLINHHIRTVADTGAEGISCLFDGDPKTCVIAIATINAAGEKLPLWIVAKGKTGRCENRYRKTCARAMEEGKLLMTHQLSGWTNSEVAKKFLIWLSETHSTPLVLLWDLFSAHRDPSVQETAHHLGIRLEFVPAGATGELQPLDRRVFGSLKQRARRRFDEAIIRGEKRKLTIEGAIKILLSAWVSIAQDELVAAWHPFHGDEESGTV